MATLNEEGGGNFSLSNSFELTINIHFLFKDFFSNQMEWKKWKNYNTILLYFRSLLLSNPVLPLPQGKNVIFFALSPHPGVSLFHRYCGLYADDAFPLCFCTVLFCCPFLLFRFPHCFYLPIVRQGRRGANV